MNFLEKLDLLMQLTAWLEALKAAADEKAIQLLIERIDIESKTAINITSTLTAVLGEHGRGEAQHILPKILFGCSRWNG